MTSPIDHFGTMFAPGNRRRPAFFVVLALAFVPYLIVVENLSAVVLGWIGQVDFAHHQIHDMAFGGLAWVTLIALLIQFYRPKARRSAMMAIVLMWLLVAGFTLATSRAGVFMLLFAVPPAIAALLHPAGRDLIRVDRQNGSKVLLGLALVASIPLLVFAGDQLIKQVTLADDHAVIGHWSGMAGISVGLLAMAIVTSLGQPGYRLTGWLTGGFTAYLGALSLGFPTVTASNVGTLWAIAAIAWGVAFVISTEWQAQHRSTSDVPPAEFGRTA